MISYGRNSHGRRGIEIHSDAPGAATSSGAGAAAHLTGLLASPKFAEQFGNAAGQPLFQRRQLLAGDA